MVQMCVKTDRHTVRVRAGGSRYEYELAIISSADIIIISRPAGSRAAWPRLGWELQ